jgi:hypothetical protein
MGGGEGGEEGEKKRLPLVEVEIENVLHEYTTIEGVQEDVTDILLNSGTLLPKFSQNFL